MDCWIIGFEFKIKHRSKVKKKNFEIAVLNFPYITFFVLPFDLQQSSNPWDGCGLISIKTKKNIIWA
jgi:hypothetical protein